ncbi:hypothetical protein [Roseinatronobacter alkalisoli]|uniref:Uncharacterized protein n=1 Tax=Roseinatronobacter alkalisoli TaxID=3028235 RepID=A0ABT5TAV3_9RHOB|nr:hypothetical protein [Roseinatronobacter sp. HJB301]MDD7972248.1 hypothetical protein [Roseinatronobacter sp. HJB301]
MRLSGILAPALFALASSTALASVEKVSEVTVAADITAIGNEEAALFWASITDDLENAILALIVDRIDDEGAKISVRLEEVALASAFERSFDLEQSVLVGQVNVTDETDNSNFNSYELSVSLSGVTAVDEYGEPLLFESVEAELAYQTLITAFAEGVVARLD